MSAAARRVVILGSTGSIGRQALDVIGRLPELLEVVGLAAGTDADALAAQAETTGVKRTGLGEDAAIELARSDEADVVLNAIVGAVGLRASLAALEAGKTLALANKESLVAGGELCSAAAARGGAGSFRWTRSMPLWPSAFRVASLRTSAGSSSPRRAAPSGRVAT